MVRGPADMGVGAAPLALRRFGLVTDEPDSGGDLAIEP
jgi:hypothetical protein